MTAIAILLIGVVLAALILSGIPKVRSQAGRAGAALVALLVLVTFTIGSSFRYVGSEEVGVVIKKFGVRDLPSGRIIATAGEKGPQAAILAPGWHAWLWPIVYDVEIAQLVRISDDEVGILTAADGRPLPNQTVFAPEWDENDIERMLDASHFLTDGGGFKGPQTTVLTPGRYRLNPRLFEVEKVPVTNVAKATVGVIKSNVGPLPDGVDEQGGLDRLVDRGERGVWRIPFEPQKLYLNPNAYEITPISTAKQVVRYTADARAGEEREIEVRSSDGFTFPVDVRIEYEILPDDAPAVVARLGDDGDRMREVLNSAVRAIFRNNAESVKALDYVKQRSQQESQSLRMLQEEMKKVGVTVAAVRIGNVGNEQTLGTLLKTQTDREIALQEQLTFQEQQRAAEQKKALTRTTQEAEEEKRLATAQYQVQIAELSKDQRIIEAQAEAEAIRIQAEAQAQAFAQIAQQIGQRNAAMLELLKIVGERGIQITPRVMVAGPAGAADAEQTALIGTMLDTLLSRDDPRPVTGATATPASER